MQKLSVLGILIISICVLNSCNEQSQDIKSDNITNDVWPYGTMYEIFIQSFADSNGDGITDIGDLVNIAAAEVGVGLAIVLLIVTLIHVTVAFLFGYVWLF